MTSLLRWRQRGPSLGWRPRTSPIQGAPPSLRELAEQYSAILQDYCAGGNEAALFHAYELGRRAATGGLSLLDMAAVHQDALVAALVGADAVSRSAHIAQSACELFAECLAPFELTRRVYQDRAREVGRPTLVS